ncbi:cation transporter [Phaeodactylibacter luteus]|uniref:Cation transporter n=2 Tax=Phaeodactylibacter luteus TaxID=1564516 RepID=A0A5C6RKG2_9BACT|nr:cation transporter [Phaeodactylibacter luteus]
MMGLLLMGIKFWAWWATNSNAILTDALESIINVVAAAFGLYSIWLAALPRDRNHPYGHGKIEFISAGFEGALIAIAGITIMGKGVYNLFHPQPIQQLTLGLALTAGAGLANYLLGVYLQRAGRENNALILIASGAHLKSDAYSSAGLVAGLGLVMATGIPMLDNLLALGFGAVILITGYRLVRESVAGIMDEADYQLIEKMVQTLREKRHTGWIDIHNFRVIKYGATLHIDCHMTLPWYYDLERGHDEVKAFEEVMKNACSGPVELFVHIDPCEPPANCALCPVQNCMYRQQKQEAEVIWTLDNIMKNQKHQL